MLWPNLDGAASRTNLRQVLSALQRAFTELGLSHLLRAEKNTIGLVPSDPCDQVFDIDLLDPLIVEEGDLIDVLVQGPGWHHRGLFLEGVTVTDGSDFEDWLAFTRQHYQRRELRLMCRLRDRLRADGRHGDAIDLGWRIVKADGWNEAHHRALMVLLAEEGSRHEAMQVYTDLERALRRHLDCAPSAETRDLHRRLTGLPTP
ncbi:bacterial transcriptional activator domain-containing protein [Luteimonas sp BLCC-B24]|uniref:AfsR/SARP family transcriptional regulator n=1 Tax=Luteimonas sp. BLCC-B24 TaxID=3025317 RepID=UPI00234DD226|nr:bacterial transcriptional activator domain-containing protein [Luteimonas sp. BLCC-B24]MDC7805915.1 bacterial transcriptional activator domain-containing protein [Luteimonas sp. BLCC-B24]